MKASDSDGRTGAQRTGYGKGGAGSVQGKEVSMKSIEGAKGGGESGTGPTGSSRSYPKGKSSGFSADFNPMKHPATDYAVGGVGKGD